MATWQDHALFLTAWLRDPRGVGSLAPSAPALVRRMVSQIPWHRAQTVVELGAGTGAITARVQSEMPLGVRFLVFERDPDLRELLRERFPHLPVHAEARNLSAVLADEDAGSADAILSGIPFATLSEADQESLLDEIERSLAPDGVLIAFQYSPQLYRRLKQRFAHVRIGFAFLNLPPAIIYRCSRTRVDH